MHNIYKQIPRVIKTSLFAVLLTLFSVFQSNGQVVQFAPGGTGAGFDQMPLGTLFGFQTSQMKYDPSYLTVGNGWAAGASYYIDTVAFYLDNLPSGQASSTPTTVFMKTTAGPASLTATTISAAKVGYSQVFSGSLNSAAWVAPTTWVKIKLSTPYLFVNNGTNNLEIIVETAFGGTGFGSFNSTDWGRTTTVDGDADPDNFMQTWLADGAPNANTGNLSTNRPNVRFSSFLSQSIGCAPPAVSILTQSTTTNTCFSNAFTLSLSNNFYTPTFDNASCFTYQWESAPTAGGPWTPIGGATSPTLSLTQAASTFYRCVINTAGFPGLPVNSSALQVIGFSCYCTSASTNTNDTDIGQVVFGAMANPATPPATILSNPLAVNTYSDFTSTVAASSYTQGFSYPISVTHITSGGSFFTAWANVFIDYNRDGTFDPNTERAWSAPAATTQAAPTVTGSVTIPFSATPGITRMRVVFRETCCGSLGGPLNPPCGNFNWGEVEDYNVNIMTAAPCNVTNLGTATASATSVCTGQSFVLDVTGAAGYGSGMTFQWQASPSNSPFAWVNIPGATANSYAVLSQSAPTWYRLVVTCPLGLSGGTVDVFVNQRTLAQCACVPTHPPCGSPFISNVTLTSTIAPNLNNSSICTSLNGNAYSVYPATGTATTKVVKGQVANLSVTTQTGNAIISVWIDWMNDGFTASDHFQVSLSNVSGAVATIPIPVPTGSGSVIGPVQMRVRSRAAGNPNGPPDFCTAFGSGEAEDYTIVIDPGVPQQCVASTVTGKITQASETNVCSGRQVNFTLFPSLNNPIVYAGVTHQWYTSTVGPAGPWTPIAGATAQTLSTTFNQLTYVMDSLVCRDTVTLAVVKREQSIVATINVSPATWLGFNTDWQDGTNWCGRVPTIVDNAIVSRPAAVLLGRPVADYKFPTVSIGDTVACRSLTINSTDSVSVVTDTTVSFNIASDLIDNGKLTILSTAAADTVTFGTTTQNTAPVTIDQGSITQPFRAGASDAIYQIIYNASELQGSGMRQNDVVDSLSFFFYLKNSNTLTNPYQDFTISYALVPVSVNSFSTSIPVTTPYTWTTIYNGGSTFRTSNPPNGTWTPSVGRASSLNYTMTTTNGSSTITVSSAANISVGMNLVGAGIPPNTTVVSGPPSTTLVLSANATATASSVPVTFGAGTMTLGLIPNALTWDGSSNIILQMCWNTTGPTAPGVADNLYMTTQPVKSTLFLSNGSAAAVANNGCTLTPTTPGVTNTFGQSPSVKRPNIRFKFRRKQDRLIATIGGNLQVGAATGRLLVSNTTMNIGSTLTNASDVTILDSTRVNLGGDMINSGTLTFGTVPALFLTGATTAASPTITGIGTTTGVAVGDFVTGAGIVPGTKVVSFTATTITMSANATQTIATNSFKTGLRRPELNFSGLNWTNNGTIVPGNSRVSFLSSSVQTIGGTNPSPFFSLNIEKSSISDNVTMNRPISVADSLVLALGQLRMNKNAINITNPQAWGLTRRPVGTPAFTSASLTLGANANVTPAITGSSAIAIGDLVTGPSLSTTTPTHVVAINPTANLVYFYPPAIGGTSALNFYRSGHLVNENLPITGEDSLSKVNWLHGTLNNVYRVVPFANRTALAVPAGIPITSIPMVTLLTNGQDIGTVSYATYKAPANSPLPPTVNHLNSIGYIPTATVTIGSPTLTVVSPGTTGLTVGSTVVGAGIPVGATIIAVPSTTSITLSANATAGGPSVPILVASGIRTLIGTTALGNNVITAIPTTASSGILVGDIINGPGIPAGSTVMATTATTITISNNATASGTGVAVTIGQAIPSSGNVNAADRFWILAKDIPNSVTPPSMEVNFSFSYDERPCPSAISPFSCILTAGQLRPQPWFVPTSPIQGQWRRLVSPYSFSFQFSVANQLNSNYVARITNWDWSLGNYNPWAVTTTNQPLPVELLSFDANLKGNDVLVEWSTASEKNNDYFTVERSLDLEKVIEIGRVSSRGDSYDLQSYSLLDREPVKGAINYYRLRQTDKDGPSEIVSDFVPVRVGLNSKFEIMYVKREGSVDVIFDYDSEAPVSYTLFDITGRVIESGNNIPTQQGLNMLQLNSSNLSQGAYTIMIQNSTDLKTYKFVY